MRQQDTRRQKAQEGGQGHHMKGDRRQNETKETKRNKDKRETKGDQRKRKRKQAVGNKRKETSGDRDPLKAGTATNTDADTHLSCIELY